MDDTMPADGPVSVDISARFKKELAAQRLPERIRLSGNAMDKAIAQRLLAQHAQRTTVADGAQCVVTLLSLESFGTAFLETFLEGKDPPSWPALLYSIPQAQLEEYARKHNIPLATEQKSAVRLMLDTIARDQPQTYYSLSKSAVRLRQHVEALRKTKDK